MKREPRTRTRATGQRRAAFSAAPLSSELELLVDVDLPVFAGEFPPLVLVGRAPPSLGANGWFQKK